MHRPTLTTGAAAALLASILLVGNVVVAEDTSGVCKLYPCLAYYPLDGNTQDK